MGKLTHTVKGPIASFRSADIAPIESLKLHFLPKQASGTPTPANPILIEGWTGVNGTRCHKNMLKVYKYSAQNSDTMTNPQLTNAYGTTINTTDGTAQELVVTQSQHPHSTASNYQNGYISIWSKTLEFGNYYDISMKVEVTDNPLNVSLGNLLLLSPKGDTKNPTVKGNILVFKNMLYSPYVRNGVDILTRKTLELRICGMSMKISEIMATPAYKSDGVYEPYSEELIPITFPDGQTIYGGYVDPIAGEIVATYAMYGLAWKDWDFGANLGNNTRKTFSINYSPYNYPKFDSGVIKTTASRCNVTNYYYNNNSDDIPHYYINSTGRVLYAVLPNDMDENTVVQISSVLAEPIEYDITPTEIQSFLDYNNFWSDANGDTEVEYEFADRLSSRKTILNEPHVETATLAPVAHFETDMVAPIKELKMYFEPWQNGYGNPSPENIRSIQGHTKATIKTSGKNMLNCMRYGISGSAANISYSIHTNEEDVIDYITAVGDNDRTNLFRNLTKSSRNGLPRGTFSFNSFSNQANILPIRQDNIPSGYANAARFTSTDGGGISASRTGWFDWDINRYDQWNSWTRIQIYPNGGPGTVNTTIYPMMCHTADRGCDFEAYHGRDYEIEFPVTKNLVNDDNVTIKGSVSKNGGTYTNTNVDSRERTALMVQQLYNNNIISTSNTIEAVIGRNHITFTVNADCDKILFKHNGKTRDFGVYIPWDNRRGTYTLSANFEGVDIYNIGGFVFSDIQIEIGSTATAYEPYGTVYGGYIDLVRGKIVATHGQINLKNKPWYKYTSNQFSLNTNKKLTSTSVFCDSLPISTTNGYPIDDKSLGFYSNGMNYCDILFIKYTDSNELSDFTAWLNNLEVDPCVVYELSTPIEYDIAPQILKTLKGTNNIWSDLNGDVEVKYWTH